MYEVGNLRRRCCIVICVALKYSVRFQGILHSNQGNVRLLCATNEENKRFFTHKFLIISHTAYAMMQKLTFQCDPELDAQFPAKRLCRVRMILKDGRTVVSDVHEPRGEAFENIGYDWLAEKFLRITGHKLTRQQQDELIADLKNDNWTVRNLVHKVNNFIL